MHVISCRGTMSAAWPALPTSHSSVLHFIGVSNPLEVLVASSEASALSVRVLFVAAKTSSQPPLDITDWYQTRVNSRAMNITIHL